MEEILNSDNATQAIGKINGNFEEVENKILGVHGTVKDLFIGTLAPIVNTGVNNPYTCSNSGIAITSPNYTTLSMQSIVGWPHDGLVITAHCPEDYRIVVLSGEIDSDSPKRNLVSLGSLADGDTATVPATDGYYNVQIKRANGGTMDLQTVQDLVDSGEIRITYEDNEPDVVARNVDCEKYAYACRRPRNNDGAGINYYPVITHISDLHGDAHRLGNAIEWSERNGIDAVVHTGDAVQYYWFNGVSYLDDISKRYAVKFVNIIGNHDVYGTSGNSSSDPFEKGLMQWFINPLKERNGYLQAAGETTTNTWYYTDIVKDANNPKRNLRIIVLNEYVDGVYSGFSGSGKNNRVRFTKAQLDWLRDTLLSTPTGYGIIICYHGTEMPIIKDGERGAFWVHNVNGNESGAGGSAYAVGYPIMKIVDAFINKASYSVEVTERNADSSWPGDPYTISGDFSSVDASTEFLAYLCGHNHSDNIGVLNVGDNANSRQVSLMIASANANYGHSYKSGANESDMPRGKTGSVQDAFNQYVFDRDKGSIRVARIGSNVSRDFVERTWMEIPYK